MLDFLSVTAQTNTIILIIVFIGSLFVLVKGADLLLEGAERLGDYFRLPSFVIGALIVGVGTSLPELFASFFSVFNPESVSLVAANAIGSNVANILLVAGLSAVVGGVIISTKELIRLEIPLLVISTALFIFVSYDKVISLSESIFIAIAFIIYLVYLLKHKDANDKKEENVSRKIKKITTEPFLILAGGAGLALGASYLIDSVVAVSEKFQIAPDIIGLSAVAVGTSFPEIVVSVKAVLRGKTDLAFGNVFGSNVFNMLMIVGITGVVGPVVAGKELFLDEQTFTIALPFLAVTTLIFYVSATSKKIYVWEGLMYLLFYALFTAKIFNLL